MFVHGLQMLSEWTMLFASDNMTNPNTMASQALRELLPPGWRLNFPASHPRTAPRWLELEPPSGPPVRFALEARSRFEPRDVDQLVLTRDRRSNCPLLLIAPHLSSRSQELLRERSISYADFCGSIFLASGSIFIDRAGRASAPPAPARPRRSLRGPVTARAVRLLCDTFPPLKIRDVAAAVNTAPGNISRLIAFLEAERVVQRSARGSIVDVDWQALLRRWSPDLEKERDATAFLEPHGIDEVLRRLRNWDTNYAITGPYAAAEIALVALPVTLDLYVDDVQSASQALKLRTSDRVGNVRLVQAFDGVVFERSMRKTGLTLAAPSQIAADLLTMPKRSTEEFDALIRWMNDHERVWRKS